MRKDEKFGIIVLFVIAAAVRLVPEIIAYPYPIGYDVINYYLPVLTNFENHWNVVSGQFPLYVLLLHLITNNTNLSPDIVIRLAAIVVYGLFAVSVYHVSRRIFHLGYSDSIFMSLFVIFQISSMRTSWDLHKDMLSLTLMFFALSIGREGRNLSKVVFLAVLSLSIVSALTDRMIGLLLIGTLITSSLVQRRKEEGVIAAFTSIVFIVVLLHNFNQIETNVRIFSEATNSNTYQQINLIILFLVTNGVLIPFGIVSFMTSGKTNLKIPLLFSLVGALSWIIYPHTSSLLPDRWIFIFSILLSMFAAHGIAILIKKRSWHNNNRKHVYFLVALVPFITIGMLFAITGSSAPLSIFAPFNHYIGQFGPVTMQSNSISIPESKSIVSAIDWINRNTPVASNMAIDKHWRGWSELELRDRNYVYYEDLAKLAEQHKNYYILVSATASVPNNQKAKVQLVYSNDNFSLYEVSSIS